MEPTPLTYDHLPSFEGKTVLITGAATGIGRAVAIAFAHRGARVAIGDVNDDAAKETLRLVQETGAEAFYQRTNVADEAEVEALVTAATERFGQLDCAFNNAGIAHAPKPIAELESEDFDRVIAVDLRGVFLCCKYEIRAMLKSGGGAIVNTTSVAGLIAEPGVGAYVTAKHGVIGLTRAAALDYAAHGIRVNALAPGWVATPMTADWENPELNKRLRANNPSGRPASPEEMVAPVLYLCSDAASYVTGQVHVADGGLTIRGMFPTDTMAAL